ncbi:MAG: PD-(D/E)XK nuclease family protein [Symbiobacteriia bacterium]
MLELVTLNAGRGGREEVLGELERAVLAGEEGSLLYLCAARPLLEETRRQLLERPGVLGLGRLRLVLFQGLVDLILREAMQAKPPLTPAVRDALLGAMLEQLTGQGRLERLAPIAATRGLARTVAGLIAELKRANIRPTAWRRAATTPGHAQVRDVAEVYEAYQQALEQMQAVDPDDLGLWALDALVQTQGAFFRGDPARGTEPIRRVVVDGYQDFTPVQLAWLQVAAALAPAVTVYLEYDPDRPELYQAAEGTVQALEEIAGGALAPRAAAPDAAEAADVGDVAIVANVAGARATLRLLAEELFRPRSRRTGQPLPPAPTGLEVLAAQDEAAEARELARLIRQALLTNPGLAPRDIAVFYRELGPEADLLAQSLQRAGVPCSRRYSLPLAEVPIVRAALRLLQAAADPDRFDGILAAAKTGYLDLAGLAGFESIARELGAGISTRQWLERLDATLARLRQEEAAARGAAAGRVAGDQDLEQQTWRITRDLRRFGSARRLARDLLRRIGRWPRPLPLATAARLTEETLTGLGLGQSALQLLGRAELPADEVAALAARDLAALEGMLEAARSLQAALQAAGLTEVVPNRWLADLEQALGHMELPLATLTQQGPDGVQLLAAPAARRLHFRLVALAGLTDGRFPKRFSPDWLLPDREREALQALGLRLDTRRDLLSAERLHFYQAAACAGERLVLSYPAAAADGSAQLPSPFLAEVLELFPAGTVPVRGPAPGQLWPAGWDQAASPEELQQMVVSQALGRGGQPAGGDSATRGDSGDSGDSATALLAVLRQSASLSASIWPRVAAQAERNGIRWGPHDGQFTDPAAQAAVSERYNPERSFSVSQLNAYGTCPFSFYAERVLRLAPPEEAGEEADPLAVGSLYHQILHAFWDGHRGEPIDAGRRQAYLTELAALAETQLQAFEAWGLRANQGLWRVKRREIMARLLAFLDWELDLAAGLREAPAPTLLEAGFGMPGLDPASRREPVQLGGEDGFLLKGKVDRVDRFEDGGYIVLDYKTGGTPKVKDMRAGRDLQVPLYLRAVQQMLGPEAHPLGGGYQSIRQQNRTQGLWRQSEAGRTGVSRGRGVFADAEWENLLAASVDRATAYARAIRHGDFPVAPNGECPPLCPYQRVCRWEARRVERKDPIREGTGG